MHAIKMRADKVMMSNGTLFGTTTQVIAHRLVAILVLMVEVKVPVLEEIKENGSSDANTCFTCNKVLINRFCFKDKAALTEPASKSL